MLDFKKFSNYEIMSRKLMCSFLFDKLAHLYKTHSYHVRTNFNLFQNYCDNIQYKIQLPHFKSNHPK